MTWVGCDVVETRPGKVSGVPLLRGSRVQADTVLESFRLGENINEIADSFQLNPADICALLEFAGERVTAGAVR